MRIPLGECVVDRARRLVLRRGVPVRISPQGFRLLEILLDEAPSVVPKEQLLARLWPDAAVVPANLSNLVAEVRAVIGDSARAPKWLKTVHTFGYGLDGIQPPVGGGGTDQPSIVCWLVHKDGRAALTEGSHLLGRHPRSVVLIDSATVSRLHARITVVGGEATIADLGSRNGTHVGRVRVCAPMPLRDGDAIVIGGVTLEFRTADLRDPTDELPRH